MLNKYFVVSIINYIKLASVITNIFIIDSQVMTLLHIVNLYCLFVRNDAFNKRVHLRRIAV